MSNKDVIGLPEAAVLLGVHYVTAVRWAKAGKFPGAYRLPGGSERSRYRVDRKALLRWKRENK